MDIQDISQLNFGEAIGFYLHEKGRINDPRDVGQAKIERQPAGRGDNGEHVQAVNRIAYIRRSGPPEWHTMNIEPTPEAFLWELMTTVLRHPGYSRD